MLPGQLPKQERDQEDQQGPSQKGQTQAEGKGWDWLDNSFLIPSPEKGLLHTSPTSHTSAVLPGQETDLETQPCALHKSKAKHKALPLSRISNTSRMDRYSQAEPNYPTLWQELRPPLRAGAPCHLLPKDQIVLASPAGASPGVGESLLGASTTGGHTVQLSCQGDCVRPPETPWE